MHEAHFLPHFCSKDATEVAQAERICKESYVTRAPPRLNPQGVDPGPHQKNLTKPKQEHKTYIM